MSEILYVVPCSQTKHPVLRREPLPARFAYIGQAFRMLSERLQRERAKWCILSGGYGFLWPDTTIEFYDMKIEPVRERMVWDDAFDELKQKQYGRLRSAEKVIVLGSRLYASNAAWLLDREVEAPFAGLPIGRMLQAIKSYPLEGAL